MHHLRELILSSSFPLVTEDKDQTSQNVPQDEAYSGSYSLLIILSFLKILLCNCFVMQLNRCRLPHVIQGARKPGHTLDKLWNFSGLQSWSVIPVNGYE